MKKNKTKSRLRRALRTRSKIAELNVDRLSIHRTTKHIYAQVISAEGGNTLVAASSVEPEMRSSIKYSGNVDAAKAVGEKIAQRAKDKGIDSVAFDRSGFRYHGRVKALAEAAREAGLKF